MRRMLLVLAIVAMTATSVQAGAFVWWEYVSGPGTVVDQGQGKTLVISGGPGSYELIMKIATDAALDTQGCTGERNTLWRGADLGLTLTSDPVAGNLNPLGWTGTSGYTAGTVNVGDGLIKGWGRARGQGQTPVSASNSPQTFIAATINVAGAVGTGRMMYQTVGSGFYGWNPPTPTTLNVVSFGPNGPVAGGTAPATMPVPGDTFKPVVKWIPEPGTLALLALGLIGLIRRR